MQVRADGYFPIGSDGDSLLCFFVAWSDVKLCQLHRIERHRSNMLVNIDVLFTNQISCRLVKKGQIRLNFN